MGKICEGTDQAIKATNVQPLQNLQKLIHAQVKPFFLIVAWEKLICVWQFSWCWQEDVLRDELSRDKQASARWITFLDAQQKARWATRSIHCCSLEQACFLAQ